MRKLITLLAGYAAGLAIAMKYKKAPTRAKKADPSKSKMETFIDDVVDMHKTAFEDIKTAVTSWEGIDSFDALQTKVKSMVDEFGEEVNKKIAELKTTGSDKKEELIALADKTLAEKESAIESAREKAASFTDVAAETIDGWLTDARTKLTAAHKKIKDKIEKDAV